MTKTKYDKKKKQRIHESKRREKHKQTRNNKISQWFQHRHNFGREKNRAIWYNILLLAIKFRQSSSYAKYKPEKKRSKFFFRSRYNKILHDHCIFCCLRDEITPFINRYMAHAVMSELNSHSEAKKREQTS